MIINNQQNVSTLHYQLIDHEQASQSNTTLPVHPIHIHFHPSTLLPLLVRTPYWTLDILRFDILSEKEGAGVWDIQKVSNVKCEAF